MRVRAAALLTVLLTLAATALAWSSATAQAAPGPATAVRPVAGQPTAATSDFGCATAPAPGHVRCFGRFRPHRTAAGGLLPRTTGSSTTVGYTPADLRSAYHLTGTSGGGRTVAVVDAYDDPRAESDLATYRAAYGLPACTAANGCFRKVNEHGAASPLPATDYGWAEEISLDLDMVSAICPDCRILLVEAATSDSGDLDVAEDTAAATSGVAAISNSWGGAEDSSTLADDAHFDHPGVAITASSGDSGYGVSWPASSGYVTAVGGTTLSRAPLSSRGWTETAWSGSGSGCSAQEAKPSWQHDTGCAHRTVADVAAVADPNTGVAVYDTANNCGSSVYCDVLLSLGLDSGADGWGEVGGTSAASPVIASVYALAGNSASAGYGSYPYAHSGALYDVTAGSNGTCSPSYLCTAGTGYDGPTGLGTPNGTGAF